MKKIFCHFKKEDPLLYRHLLLLENKIMKLGKEQPQNYFNRLCREIICQQLSNKSGNAIFTRFLALFPNENVQPADILQTSHEYLRATGMSNAKASYVRNLAEHIAQGKLNILELDTMPDSMVVQELTKVKGIGPWTAEMFLMFTLGRQDIFSFGDLGLKKGLIKVYNLKKEPTKKQIERIISRWSPYKTYGSLVLWASLEE